MQNSKKRILMCPPTHFNISYEINPWMKLDNQVNSDLAHKQWQKLHDIYTKKLGWQVDLIKAEPKLPDMVFTANGGLVVGQKALVANFRHPDRQAETAFFKAWFESNGYPGVVQTAYNFEGEGDGLLWNDYILVGYPWRSDQSAHREIATHFQKEVISLQLTDARFYHLDTCLTSIDRQTIAIYEPAFSAESLKLLQRLVPRIIKASQADAVAYGLNACCDGQNIVIPNEAQALIESYQKMGFNVLPTPISEFKKSGGGVKCLTLELH